MMKMESIIMHCTRMKKILQRMILKVAINIKKVDKKVKIKKQELPSFTRKGFTAIEWGETIYKE